MKICGHGTVLALYRCAQNASSTRAWAMEHEAFAHFFEASMGDSIKLQRLTKLFPNSVRVFNQMLDAIIKNAEPYDREQRERAIWEER